MGEKPPEKRSVSSAATWKASCGFRGAFGFLLLSFKRARRVIPEPAATGLRALGVGFRVEAGREEPRLRVVVAMPAGGNPTFQCGVGLGFRV